MKRICQRCNQDQAFEVPLFKNNEKLELVNLMKESPIRAVKDLINKFKLNHADAKFIVSHMNEEHGQCNRCNFNKLDTEYMTCPKCKALNFNWDIN